VEITGLNSDDVISSISTVNIDNVSYDSGIYTVAISGMWSNNEEITLTIVKSGYRIEGSLTTVLNLAPISLNISIITQPTNIYGETYRQPLSTNLVITETTHTFDDWDNISLELADITAPAKCVAYVDSSTVSSYTKTFTIKTSSNAVDYSGNDAHLITPSLHYSNQDVKFNLTFGNINNFTAYLC
jgi:hypothetical protein